ncbi:ABC transporter permease [Schaalia sp. lx-260]|uniref:ABC transporter permease n=1 Tax=Schaalia sp. lx-260 TaxID=2899082 RepID=UPI001E398A7B|nr:ABC transporter permease [Schaalia sp. lx-260]MCD4548949.1 ABC transporter permease [Schaalia sp. lx-260]
MAAGNLSGFTIPGKSQGLWGVIQQRYLLNLIVKKELRIRYRGSYLGMLWSYAKPATQFLVFYVAIGKFMGMSRAIENYVVYMFSGVVLINYFSEIFGQATRSIVQNKELVRKIYLPRELFPISSVRVAIVHLFPQLVILSVGALLFGWRPGFLNLLAIVAGFVIMTLFALGLGLCAAALNVMFRDTENFVDLLLMIATWASPVLYMWTMVDAVFTGPLRWLWYVYMSNPLSVCVELFHYAFWHPTAGVRASLLPHFGMWVAIGCVISLAMLVLGERTFRHYDGNFAQEL